MEDFPWPLRLANALIAYCQYLGKCFLPERLAVFYPYFAVQPPLRETLLAGALLAGITWVAIALLRTRPYLLVGWLWFVGTLVPVIGLVQVGGQSLADRYTYVPLIGIFIMVAWGGGDLAHPWRRGNRVLGAAGCAALIVLATLTSRQLGFWKDGTSLFRHALAVTEDNWVAHANLFATLSKSSPDEARVEFRETTRILSAFADTYDRKGIELEKTAAGLPEAIKDFRTAIRIIRVLPGPHYNLGTALTRTPGGLPEAIEEFETATRLDPGFVNAHYNLGIALMNSKGRQTEAIEEFRAVVRLRPDFADAHYNLGRLLSGVSGRETESISEFQAAIALQPGHWLAHYYLGLALAGIPGRTQEAIQEFEAALRAKPDLEQASQMIGRLRGSAR
jgi:protein O-mannosyl-transferase